LSGNIFGVGFPGLPDDVDGAEKAAWIFGIDFGEIFRV
jgi:hypothetical protein